MGSVISKWNNAMILWRDPELRQHIPVTVPLTKQHLHGMLQEFPFVYLKPDNSCQGKGLFRIDRMGRNRYLMRARDVQFELKYENFTRMCKDLRNARMRRPYIIQEGISSQTPGGAMMDIRVHLTRVDGKWEIAGLVGRVAQPRKIATNAYSGGKSVHVDELLTKEMGYSEEHAQQTIEKLKSISERAVQRISARYPSWSEYGLDIGIDKQGHLWIYEINIRPGTLVFKNLSAESCERVLELRKKAR
jgi:hypothetical protein